MLFSKGKITLFLCPRQRRQKNVVSEILFEIICPRSTINAINGWWFMIWNM
jgi:hypothetical protein